MAHEQKPVLKKGINKLQKAGTIKPSICPFLYSGDPRAQGQYDEALH